MPILIGMTDVRNQRIPSHVIPAKAGIHASFEQHALCGALASVAEWARQPGRKAPRRERRPSADTNNHWTTPLATSVSDLKMNRALVDGQRRFLHRLR